MGCLCARAREFADSDKAAKQQATQAPPVSTTRMAVTSHSKKNSVAKIQLGLPVDTEDGDSTPRRNRSNLQVPSGKNRHLRVPSESGGSSSRSGSSGRRRSSAELADTVKVRDFRAICGRIETYFQLTCNTMGSLTKAKHPTSTKTCWVQAHEFTPEMNSKEMQRRLMMLKSLDHPNILNVLSLLHDDSHFYAVYEATEGRTAEELIASTRGISECWSAAIMRQVFAALRHCHSKGLVLKSLSLQHIHFAEPPTEDCFTVKLFISLDDVVGPEDAKLGESMCQDQCLLSCGVILCTLLAVDLAIAKPRVLIASKESASSHAKWQGVSDQAKSFALALMSHKCPTIEQCLQHPWIAVQQKPTLTPSLRTALGNLAKLRPTTSLKKSLLQLMLTLVLPSKDLREAQDAFKELDTDLDGAVSEEELRVQMARLYPEEQTRAALTAIAANAVFSAERKMAYSEFLIWACGRKAFASASHLILAFQLLDKDKDGVVSHTDLREFLCLDSPEDSFSWQMLVCSISHDTQGYFSYQEFANYMLKR